MNYIPLYVKTNYSLLSSLVDIKKLIKKLKDCNVTSIAITDTNVLYGVMAFYHECIKNEITPIIGLELEVNNYKILLYARNYKGYQNLCKLVTIKSEQDIEIEQLIEYKDNLICIIPYHSINIYNDLRDIYDVLYGGYSRIEEKEYLINNNINFVFINEVLCLNKIDYKYVPYIYAIRDNKKIEDIKHYSFYNNHLMSSEEVLKIFDKKDLDNTISIGNMCNIQFPTNNLLLPLYNDKIDNKNYLEELCKKGLSKRLNNKVEQIYSDRLYYELDVINKMGFEDYFLVVWDFVKHAKKNNILVGPGRGSSASSLVSYSLGITDVDPIKYDLLFERFLNVKRVTMPDIDIDFPDIHREKVIEYVIKKYGNKKVAQIITFGTFGVKQTIRDLGRVLDIPIKIIDKLAGMVQDNNVGIKDMYNNNKNFNETINSMPSLRKLYEIATFIEGMPRHASIHAAGIVICNQELDNIVPLMKSNNKFYTIGYTMDYLEELGLLKMDFLGLRNLTLIMEIINKIKEVENIDLNFNTISLDDAKTLQIFNNVDTEGIFQFESFGMKKFLDKLKVTTFDDVVVANALFRPGPMDNINLYVNRKHNKNKIDYIHPDLYKILSPTYGIIVYQEQIMQIASIIAGYSLGEADLLRRAISKKKEDALISEKSEFIKRSADKGYNEETAEKVYNFILKFANYGFNKAHSVAYSLIGYEMAYLKAHYFKYFIISLLDSAIGSEVKTKKYIYEAKKNNISILKPDINLSSYLYTLDDIGIRLSFTSIRNIGLLVCDAIMEEREKAKYQDFIDFICRTYNKIVNKRIIESLIYAGCFNSFGYNKKTLIYNLEVIINYAFLMQNLSSSLIDKPNIEVVKEFSKEELMDQELEYFGFYLNVHPITKYKEIYSDVIDIDNISKYFNEEINMIVYIENMKVIKTKKNEEMAFISCSDELSKIDIVLFGKVYQLYKDTKKGDIIKIRGRVERRLSTYQIIVSKLNVLG